VEEKWRKRLRLEELDLYPRKREEERGTEKTDQNRVEDRNTY
jgi:hypothetical protein